MDSSQNDLDRQKLLNCLTTADYGPQQIDNLKRRYFGTGQWFLDSSGKTIITPAVINDLCTRSDADSEVGVAYIYGDIRYQKEQELENLLLSLVKQLCQRQSHLPQTVDFFCHWYQGGEPRPLLENTPNLLDSMAATYLRIFIVVDALDELPREWVQSRVLVKNL
ncbi:hypothetical protein BDZ45DRAFT_748394 [Acephala macrosclerotiorum]|nr:hypothetical protein BDZ45DRAFT_748394 [Acephala macrosclerotiorum]